MMYEGPRHPSVQRDQALALRLSCGQSDPQTWGWDRDKRLQGGHPAWVDLQTWGWDRDQRLQGRHRAWVFYQTREAPRHPSAQKDQPGPQEWPGHWTCIVNAASWRRYEWAGCGIGELENQAFKRAQVHVRSYQLGRKV